MDPKALYTLSYGLYVISARDGEKVNGQVANTVFQITSDPATVAVSINKKNLTHGFITSGKKFLVSVLTKDTPLSLIGRFGFKSGRETDKFADVAYKLTPSGLPYLTENCLAYMEAEVKQAVDCGTHTIFIGVLTAAEVLLQGEPMTYAYYHQVKRGKTPKPAPTYTETEGREEVNENLPKYRCTICNYIYDPAAGDPDNGVPPGTVFDDLPGDWVCPVCGAGKEVFEKV